MPEWKDTVNLPRTEFPMKASLPTSEPETLARWAAMDLYGRLLGRRPSWRGEHPGYGTANTLFRLDNTYLELLLELGIPAALLLLFGLGWIVAHCARGALTRKRDQHAANIAVGASVLVGLHALVDFSIQLQGVALSYAALLGAGYAQSWSSRENG